MIKELKLDPSYIAGFFDGEGCINTSKSGLRATITNTDLEILLLIKEYFNKGKIRQRVLKEWETRKPCFMLEYWSNEAVEFLNIVYPFLIVKKEQARLAFEYQNTYRRKTKGKGTFGIKAIPKEMLLLREDLAIKIKRLKHEKTID